MTEWSNTAGDILEELCEAEKLGFDAERSELYTFSYDCGGTAFTLICC